MGRDEAKEGADGRLDRIFRAAGAVSLDVSRVEAGFETRVLARIRGLRERRPWFAAAWRLVPLFTAIAIALGAWYYVTAPAPSSDMRSVITAEYENSLALNYLTGG